jgi:predicted Abi (CAAX) family protease
MSQAPAPIRPIRKARDYVLSKQSELNHPAAFPLAQQLAPAYYRPLDAWLGRLVLPRRPQRRADRGVWFEVYHAPDEHQALIGQQVWLRWSSSDDSIQPALVPTPATRPPGLRREDRARPGW